LRGQRPAGFPRRPGTDDRAASTVVGARLMFNRGIMSKKWRKAARPKAAPTPGAAAAPAQEQGHNPMPDNPNPPAGPQPLTYAQKNEAWWKLIGRYDFYFGSVNTKAALLVAFNTFVAGAIVLKWDDIRKTFG